MPLLLIFRVLNITIYAESPEELNRIICSEEGGFCYFTVFKAIILPEKIKNYVSVSI
jgi:hypothetical protein